MGDHFEDPGHLFGLGRVDAVDVGMGDRGLDQGQVKPVVGQLEAQVGSVVQGAGYFGDGAGPGVFGAPDAAVGRNLEIEFVGRHFTAQHLGRIHHRVHQRFVAGAAAGIAVLLKPVADVLTGGRRIFIQQGFGRDDEPGAAESALGAAVGHPGQLQGMQAGGGADAFDGGDMGAVGHPGEFGDAGAHQFAVHDDIACRTLALATAHLRAGQAELFPEHCGQRVIGRCNQNLGGAVEDNVALNHVPSPNMCC